MTKSSTIVNLILMEEAAITSQLDGEIKSLLVVCFPEEQTAFLCSRHWHGSAPACTLVHRRDKSLVGHVGIVLRTVQWNGRNIPAAGIQNLAVAPSMRGTGLSRTLMMEAMAEAGRRGVPFGLLFCVPGLERFYASLGWQCCNVPVTMRDEKGLPAPIPARNIAMALSLGPAPIPKGPLDLMGRDW